MGSSPTFGTNGKYVPELDKKWSHTRLHFLFLSPFITDALSCTFNQAIKPISRRMLHVYRYMAKTIQYHTDIGVAEPLLHYFGVFTVRQH